MNIMTERAKSVGFVVMIQKDMNILTEKVKIFQSPYETLFKVCHGPACEN